MDKTMNKQELKTKIEEFAKEEGLTFIEACQVMQGASAKMQNEEMITVIHELKMESVK